MPVRWSPETDQMLLLKILETHKISVNAEAIAAAWPTDRGEVPTARAIKERLFKIRQLSNKGGTGSFTISGGKGTTTPKGHARIKKINDDGDATPPSTKKRKVCKKETSDDENNDENVSPLVSKREAAALGADMVNSSPTPRRNVKQTPQAKPSAEQIQPSKIKSEMMLVTDNPYTGKPKSPSLLRGNLPNTTAWSPGAFRSTPSDDDEMPDTYNPNTHRTPPRNGYSDETIEITPRGVISRSFASPGNAGIPSPSTKMNGCFSDLSVSSPKTRVEAKNTVPYSAKGTSNGIARSRPSRAASVGVRKALMELRTPTKTTRGGVDDDLSDEDSDSVAESDISNFEPETFI